MSGYGRDVEYIRECGSIQGDLARRAGRLLRQYSELSRGISDEEKLDATLSVAVLSLLLTNCDEALAVMEKDDHAHLLWRDVRDIVVGLATSNFPPPVDGTVESDALSHLRNAVAHPLATRHSKPGLTGYTSRVTCPEQVAQQPVDVGPSRLVRRFEFTSSPWVNIHGVLQQYRSRSEGKVRSSLGRFERKYQCNGELAVAQAPDGLFTIVDVRTGQSYVPEFSVLLDLAQIESLALSIANFLAHAAHASWDGAALEDLLTG